MPQFIPLIKEQEIQRQIQKTGQQISKDYKGKDLVLLGVLKGSFIFLADLTRKISIDHEIDLIGASSYEGTSSTGQILFTKQPDLELKDRDVLLVEDIVDTGNTLLKIIEFITLLDPRSIKICSLIDKRERREVKIDVDYSCFSLEKGFIVGFGLDYNEKYRNLPAIYDLKL
ncbi:MAG: hypoxanthine phosphoribosyltransferase [Desulfobacula sp.]|jgi:hypoxanthine phosphoribosyltransferase|uniref:hypoxanthine phosphoribosyltransferase n=1 Tax=Desulfobacula sp. TaxID=2593537 RepID=UPI001E0A4B5B|nr:hypoxanthine phosphoribosyltransferase [Desulfobacula sp.]MBT3485858.1 hypoxanthine phosphoribosyltransferase [Desulfobacula sp.]MBT3804008.1 hypoxanthine phosphoribosyltransferase [Desulfobacula sp.]MBT4023623.1 hypoxanthine phosphoribosyltransferase [Desulfobacula sp.]MBT4197709.1 hypoxanthine phosphoribosyltransferase [Desulfobacula sp.]